ncbi:protein of unknown function (plasmid) [Candidatus Methylocalor cossyra]|uniref:DUF433 domain-containing protein n=1 Tax=Candidatus Methylocalor cossyra TaxID=3108543 RepID=A0ABM9NN61_9GAMM
MVCWRGKRGWDEMNHLNRITVNPLQYGGRPCIRGMWIRVKDILGFARCGCAEGRDPAGLPVP